MLVNNFIKKGECNVSLLSRLADKHVWENAARPTKIDDIILPDRIKNIFKNPKENIGNLLFYGHYGTGKTTLAACIVESIDIEHFYINMSMDTGIEKIRNDMMNFASHVSLSDRKKIIIGDEFDRLSPQAMDSLKSAIETCSQNCDFIFITNHIERVIPAGISRLAEVSFNFSTEESKMMKIAYAKRVSSFLKSENIKFDNKALIYTIQKIFPDMRKVYGFLQLINKSFGEITLKNVKENYSNNIEVLIKAIKEKDYIGFSKFCANNEHMMGYIFSILSKDLESIVKNEESRAIKNVLISKYYDISSRVIDKTIPLKALCTELADQCSFKDK